MSHTDTTKIQPDSGERTDSQGRHYHLWANGWSWNTRAEGAPLDADGTPIAYPTLTEAIAARTTASRAVQQIEAALAEIDRNAAIIADSLSRIMADNATGPRLEAWARCKRGLDVVDAGRAILHAEMEGLL